MILPIDPKKREEGRILTFFFLTSGGKKNRHKNSKMVEIINFAMFVKNENSNILKFFHCFFFSNPREKKEPLKSIS